jgi:hypothetical protein
MREVEVNTRRPVEPRSWGDWMQTKVREVGGARICAVQIQELKKKQMMQNLSIIFQGKTQKHLDNSESCEGRGWSSGRQFGSV